MSPEPDPFDALNEKPAATRPTDDLDALLGEHLPNALDRMLDNSGPAVVSEDEVDLESLLGPDTVAPARPIAPPKPSHDLLAGIDDLLGPAPVSSAISAAASTPTPSHDDLLAGLDDFLPEQAEAISPAVGLTPASGTSDPFAPGDDSDDLLAGLEGLSRAAVEPAAPLPESLMTTGAPERDELADLLGPAPGSASRALMVAPKGKKGRERPAAGGLLIGRPGIERVRVGEHVSARRALTSKFTLQFHLFWDGPLGYRGRENDKPRMAAATFARAVVILVIVGLFWQISIGLPPGNLFASVAPAPVALAAVGVSARPPVEFLPPDNPVGVGTLHYLDAAAATVAWRNTAAAIAAALGGKTGALDTAAAGGNLTPELAASLKTLITGLAACPGAFGSAQTCSLRIVAGAGDPTVPGNVIFLSVDRHGGTDRINAQDANAGRIDQTVAGGTVRTALAWSAVNVTIVKLSNGRWMVDGLVLVPLSS